MGGVQDQGHDQKEEVEDREPEDAHRRGWAAVARQAHRWNTKAAPSSTAGIQ